MKTKTMKWKKIENRRTFSESAEDKSIRKRIENAYTELIDLEYKIEKSGYMAFDEDLPRQIRSLLRTMKYYI